MIPENPKPLPCPKDGKGTVRVFWFPVPESFVEGGKAYIAACVVCLGRVDEPSDTEEQAIHAWNKRASKQGRG